jgi:hypothetical protein
MGEKKFFPIPAFLRVGDSEFRVLELGVDGLILEWSGALGFYAQPGGESELVGDFIFPYDGYSQIVIKDVRLRCHIPREEEIEDVDNPPKITCEFVGLNKDQEEFFRSLIKNYLLKRLISIPSEFMNYTKEEEVRRELVEIKNRIENRKKLKKFALIGTSALALFIVLSSAPKFYNLLKARESSTLTVKYVEQKTAKEEKKREKPAIKNTVVALAEPTSTSQNLEDPNPPLAPIPSERFKNLSVEVSYETPKPKEPPKPAVSYLYTDAVASNLPKGERNSDSLLSRSETYYCVQVASDFKPGALVKKAQQIAEFYSDVRVEKIGKAYTLRVGFFRDKNRAKRLARELRSYGKNAFWRSCVYRPERWVYPRVE